MKTDLLHVYSGKRIKRGALVGLELEYERASMKIFERRLRDWTLTQDHSLRGGGIEFVSRVLEPPNVDKALSLLENMLTKYEPLEPSLRCGIHVHVNMLDAQLHEVWNVITAYTLLEPTLFDVFSPSRKDNHFCTPLVGNFAMGQSLLNDIQVMRRSTLLVKPLECIRVCSKYSALNIKPLATLGTLEFRHLAATLDYEIVSRWVKTLIKLRTYALKFSDPQDIIQDYEKAGLSGLQESIGLTPCEVGKDEQEDAEDFAYGIVGHPVVRWQDMEWQRPIPSRQQQFIEVDHIHRILRHQRPLIVDLTLADVEHNQDQLE